MGNSRQNNVWTATILGIVLVGVAAWLFARGTTGDATPIGVDIPVTSVDPAVSAGEATRETTQRASELRADAVTANEQEVSDEYTADTSREPATVEIHVHFAAAANPNTERTIQFRALCEANGRVAGESQCHSASIEAIGYLEVPPNQWNHIEAEHTGAQIPGRRLHLGPGEHYRIDLACGPNLCTLRAVGPSPKLAPFLRLEITDLGHEIAAPFELPLGADGSVACHFSGIVRANVVLTGPRRREWLVPLRTHAGESDVDTTMAEVELVPNQRLLGIVVRQRGKRIDAAISLGANRPFTAASACTITTEAKVRDAESIHVHAEPIGHLRGPIDRVERSGDLWIVDTERLEGLGELRVTFTPSTDDGPTAGLVAVAAVDESATMLNNTPGTGTQDALLGAGDYRLHWAPHGKPTDIAAPFVRIAAGKVCELEVAPRALERWTVQLRDAPTGMPLSLGWDGIWAFGTSTTGDFSVAIGHAPVVGETARIIARYEHAAFAATFVSVDAIARRAEVTSTLADAAVSLLRPATLQGLQGQRGGPTRLHLLPTTEHPDVGGMLLNGRVLLAPGTARHGYQIEFITDPEAREQLTRWFEIAAGTAELTLTPIGRWATMTFAAPTPRALAILEGPAGDQVKLRVLAKDRSIPFYVAEGTTAIHVEVDGVRQTFDPRLAEFVIR